MAGYPITQSVPVALSAMVALLFAFASAGAVADTAKPDAVAKPAAAVAVEEPRDVVAAIYRLAAIEHKRTKGGSPFTNRDIRGKYFSKHFDLLVTAEETKATHDKASVLDFDPISASPEAEQQKVTLKTDMLELGKAVVSASFSNSGQPTVVTYDFLREDGAWKIDDIKGTTEKEAWSVRRILKATGRPPQELPPVKESQSK